MHARIAGHDSGSSGAQQPRHHKTQRASSGTPTKSKIAVTAWNSSSHFDQFGNSSEIPDQAILVTPVCTADLVSAQDSRKPLPQPPENTIQKWPIPVPCPTKRYPDNDPKISPSEMTLRHTWFDVHLLMEGLEGRS